MIKKSILALAVIGAGSAVYAAESSKVAFTLDVTYLSDYVFRGLKVSDSTIQPSLEASYGDFYAGLWHSNEISDNTRGGAQDETDLYAGYKLKASDTLSVDFGATRYTYSGGNNTDSTEAYIGLNANVALSPSLYAYYDFDYEVATYIANIGYSLPLESAGLSIDFSVSAGFVNFNGGQEYLYGVAGVSVPYKLSDTATLSAGVDYVANDDDQIGLVKTFGNGSKDDVVAKVGVTVSF